MANKTLQKAIAAAFALALPLGASADPNLDNYNLVDSLSSLKTDISTSDSTGFMTLGVATGTTAYETGNGIQQSLYYCTDPVEFTDKIAFQEVATSSLRGWWLRPSNGLYSPNVSRSAALINLKEGDLVQIVCSQTASNVITLTNADGAADGDFTYELSDDGYSYYITMTADGQAGFCGVKSTGYITDIYYYELDESAITVDYTVKYVNEDGDSIQADRIGTGVVGDTITVLELDKDAIYVGDSIKYVYSSDDGGIVLTADGATITVTFREADTYSYTVTAAYGSETKVIESGTAFDEDEVTVYYKEYILGSDTILYYKANNSSDPYWGTTFTIDGADYSETITYTDSGIDDVVFYTEAEDLEGMTTTTAINADIRNSQGAVAYAATSGEDVTVTTLPAGTYEITISFFSPSSSPATMYISVGSDTIVVDDLTNSYTTIKSTNVSLSDSADVKVIGGYGSKSTAIDYIYITGTVSTGISEVSAEVESGDAVSAPVYSLSGVKVREAGEGVSGLSKGVYIMNGKKFMVIK